MIEIGAEMTEIETVMVVDTGNFLKFSLVLRLIFKRSFIEYHSTNYLECILVFFFIIYCENHYKNNIYCKRIAIIISFIMIIKEISIFSLRQLQ